MDGGGSALAGFENNRPATSIPFRRRTEKVSGVIAREIVSDMRGLPPMSMLPPEAAMLEKYQVGRASLREALRILEVQGIIAIRPGPGGGPMVAPFDSMNFARMTTLYLHLTGATYREVLQARIIMEPVMARLATERKDPNAVSQLQDFLAQPEPVDESEYLVHTGGFHSLLSGLSGNRVLDLEGRGLKDIYADRIEGMVFPPEAREGIVRDHQTIARAIIAGDGARAENLTRAHMQEYLFYSAARNPGVLDEVVQWR
jgi:GntR family transcriptional regulator, transcriptional repressor for pyruvate dehydrogenase complex